MRFTNIEAVQPKDGFWKCSECRTQHEHALLPHKLDHAINSHATLLSSRLQALDPRLLLPAASQSLSEWSSYDSEDDETASMARTFVNHYATLELPSWANYQDIQEAYHRRLRRLKRSCPTPTSRVLDVPPQHHSAVAQPSMTSTSPPAHGVVTRDYNPNTHKQNGTPAIIRANQEDGVIGTSSSHTHTHNSVPTITQTNPNENQSRDQTTEPSQQDCSTDEMVQINEIEDAYQILGHPGKKKVYDAPSAPSSNITSDAARNVTLRKVAAKGPTF